MTKFTRLEAGRYEIRYSGNFVGSVFHSNLADPSDLPKGWVAALYNTETCETVFYTAGNQRLSDAMELVRVWARNTKTMTKNIMTGKEVEETIDTPFSCSVGSEAYWCS